MAHVDVKLFAVVRDRLGRDTERLEIVGALTAGDVLIRLTALYPDLAPVLAQCRVVVNRAFVPTTAAVADGVTQVAAPLARLDVDLARMLNAAELLTRATEAGVTFVRGSDFFPNASAGRSSARLAFSYETPERIAEGVALLASLLP